MLVGTRIHTHACTHVCTDPSHLLALRAPALGLCALPPQAGIERGAGADNWHDGRLYQPHPVAHCCLVHIAVTCIPFPYVFPMPHPTPQLPHPPLLLPAAQREHEAWICPGH